MIYTTPLQNYVRAICPQSPESQVLFLTEELKKLERTLAAMTDALVQIGVHVP